MRDLRANEAKVFGILGVIGIALVSVATFVLLRHQSFLAKSALLGALVPLGALSWIGFQARSIFVDGDDLVISGNSKGFLRLPISSIVSVRTLPMPYRFGILTFRFSGETSVSTLVREQDLLWLMSRMPRTSITPYWRNRLNFE